MIDGKRVLGLITARGGSKGVPRKNLYPLDGKPLLEWTVDAAKASRYLDRLVLTSDDPEIIAMALELGCEAPFVRPADLADDEASSVDVAIHAFDQLAETYDYLALLQPTSPFRTAEDIDACIHLIGERGAMSCTSVYMASIPPTWIYTLDQDQIMTPIFSNRPETTRRQVQPQAYCTNGAIFVVDIAWFRQCRCFIDPATIAYVMPAERSIDIDGEIDIQMAEAQLTSNRMKDAL